MIKKIIRGAALGAVAGIIDMIPMLLQKLSWDANLAAFSMWVVIGFFIAVTELKINASLKGILLAFLILTPSAVLIGGKEPFSLIPIGIMTLILGGLLGGVSGKINP